MWAMAAERLREIEAKVDAQEVLLIALQIAAEDDLGGPTVFAVYVELARERLQKQREAAKIVSQEVTSHVPGE